MLAVRADLADKIYEIAMRRGTLFDYVNDLLEQAIRAESTGLTLREILEETWIIKDAKEAGFMIFPQKLVYELIEKANKGSRKDLQSQWYEAGQWYGKYFENPKKFEVALKRLLWDISEFKMVKEGEEILLMTCLSSKFSEAYTELLSKFLEGAFSSFGYELEGGEVLKGIINLRFKRAKGR